MGQHSAQMDSRNTTEKFRIEAMNLIDYLTTRITSDLTATDQFRLLVSAFLLTAVSVVIIHQFLPGSQPVLEVAIHALVIATSYSVFMVLIGGLLYFLVHQLNVTYVQVWHLWLFAFVVYNLGYFVYIPLGDDSKFDLHADADADNAMFHYLRLIPVLMLLTFIFIQAYLKRTLENELIQLRKINEGLGPGPPKAISDVPITFESGRRSIQLTGHSISHISVDDHYCYIHYRDGEDWLKTDVAQPLKEIKNLLPESFLQVHRSHIVNPRHLRSIEKESRSYTLQLMSGESLPVSRHRINQVLPHLQKYLAA
jgi:hypothetical protein